MRWLPESEELCSLIKAFGTLCRKLVEEKMYVKMRDGETFEGMLKRFKLGVERAGVLREYRKHQAFLSKGERARLKAKRSARKRQSKALRHAA